MEHHGNNNGTGNRRKTKQVETRFKTRQLQHSYTGFVLTRFTVRPDGRTPFQCLSGASALCVFGESVFGMILDDEVSVAELTNRGISGCRWRRDAFANEHLVCSKCSHTHLLRSHLSVAQFVCAHPHIFMRVTHTHGCSVCIKVSAHVSFLSISLSPFLMFHPSLLFSCWSLRDHSRLRLH